jgi:cytochrome c biogenesis protein CcmG/thiol:disulfide interchange protein DsbE
MTTTAAPDRALLASRRAFLGGGLVLGIGGVGGLGFAAQTGRLPILTPELPDDVSLPPIDGVMFEGKPVRGVYSRNFEKNVIAMNVWASWCPNCRAEHAQLMRLSEEPGFCLFGIVADDTADNVRAYLKEAGNPYSHLSLDQNRVFQRAFKQRGIPATVVFRQDRTYAHRILGEITPGVLRDDLLPAINRARLRA